MRLAGERVVLRPACPEDADALAQGFADDPTLGAMLGVEPDQENAEWLRTTYPENGQNRQERKAYWFAMDHPQRGELIGEIGLVGISWPNRRAGLSILVLPAARRAGIGREAIELLVGWAQGELGLHRIELHTLSEKPLAAMRLATARSDPDVRYRLMRWRHRALSGSRQTQRRRVTCMPAVTRVVLGRC